MRQEIIKIKKEHESIKNCIDAFAKNKTNIKVIRKQLKRRTSQLNSAKTILILKNVIN